MCARVTGDNGGLPQHHLKGFSAALAWCDAAGQRSPEASSVHFASMLQIVSFVRYTLSSADVRSGSAGRPSAN